MLKQFDVLEEIAKTVVPFGNGSIVYTPKKWIGEKVTVVLEARHRDICTETIDALKPWLDKIEGIYLFGSHARNEQEKNSDVDILVISENKFAPGKKNGLDFLIMTRKDFAEKLKKVQ